MAATQHLTLEEHGAYFKLLLCAWKTERCELPADDKRIATMLGVSAGKWGKLKPAIMAFWTKTESGWMQKRLSKEREFVEGKRAKNAAAARVRWDDNTLQNNVSTDANAYAGELPPSPSPSPSQKKDSTRPTSVPEPICDPADDFGRVCSAAGFVPKAGRSDGERARLAGWISKGLEVDRDIIPVIRKHITDERYRDDPTGSLKRFEGPIAHALAIMPAPIKPETATPALADVGDGADGYRKALPESLRRGLLQDCEIRLEGGALVHIPRTGFAAEELKTTHRADLARAARQSGFEPAAIIIRDIAPRAALAR